MPKGTYPNYLLLNPAATTWTTLNPVAFGTYTMGATDKKFPLVAQQPQYVIEALCTPSSGASLGGAGCPNYLYRVTARGFGGNVNTLVTLQMIARL